MPAEQKERIMQIMTPKGKDFLLIEGLEAKEGLSQLFSFDVRLLHDEGEADGTVPTFVEPKEILGKQVSIELTQKDGVERYFSGIVNRFSQGVRHGRYSFYEAT